MQKKFSNKLINESSPYLLQHAHNPVNWYPWGEEALQKAKDENKVVLISIGYSACHWCHVMEKESFENEEVAAIMNNHFINIKIDREERPDLDHIYMDALQAMTGSGGWPLNVFLTPTAQPFYGGTYFPPARAYNRSSWTEVLQGVKEAWANRKEEMIKQAQHLTDHLNRSTELVLSKNIVEETTIFTRVQCDTIFQNVMKVADREWGGFGKAPKFPQTFTIQFLLQYYYFTGKKEALNQALLSVNKMLDGGIYDHVGGGLARYSTDTEWLAPHFEKMLYDNALLVSILCDIYQITKDPRFEKAIRSTLDFVEKELYSSTAGFYAAIDADSEGEEGTYYVWQKSQIDQLLGKDAELFCEYFNVSENGNWEGKNILRILKQAPLFAQEKNVELNELEVIINKCLGVLLKERNNRIRPLLDDKILLGWNALMITAFAKAAAALSNDHYREIAENTFNIILRNFKSGYNQADLQHTYKDGIAKFPAFLDDYACLIQACIQLQEITSDSGYLDLAKLFTEQVIEKFIDKETGYFFFTRDDQTDLIIRKKEVYDGATPSGNSVMAENLFYLSVIFNNAEWHRIASQVTNKQSATAVLYPSSFGIWSSLILKQTFGYKEITITGKSYQLNRQQLLTTYIPDKILQAAGNANENFPLLTGKTYGPDVLFYLCKNYGCQRPLASLDELLLLMNQQAD